MGNTSWLASCSSSLLYIALCFQANHALYLNNNRTKVRGIGCQRTGGRWDSWCSVHLFFSYLTWVKGNDRTGWMRSWLPLLYVLLNMNMLHFFWKGGSFDQPFLQRVGIGGWDEPCGILQILTLYYKSGILHNENIPFKNGSLGVTHPFPLTDLTAYLHYCGRDCRLSLLPLSLSHGDLCVQEHWWENPATSCDAWG